MDHIWQMDLVSLQTIAKENSGYNYILTDWYLISLRICRTLEKKDWQRSDVLLQENTEEI